MDRPFLIAFSCSLVCHALLLGVRLFQPMASRSIPSQDARELIYTYQLAEEDHRRLQARVSELLERATTMGHQEAPAPQIRIPDRAPMTVAPSSPTHSPSRAAVVDLTNLAEAAQGDPVLLSYFSAIRQQIQQAANHRRWLSGPTAEGIVYVSFTLLSNGHVQFQDVLTARSVSSAHLQRIAMNIVASAGPFAPFPPSITEPSKTIVVPLEFLVSQ